jgi:metal-responsive CopG/Arc/MetJ family transcriptional regulator
MAHLTISVPEEHVDELRRELLRAHADRAEALRHALDAYLESHARLDEVEGALVELVDLDEALTQLGWTAADERRAVELSVHPEVLADALRALDLDAEGRR